MNRTQQVEEITFNESRRELVNDQKLILIESIETASLSEHNWKNWLFCSDISEFALVAITFSMMIVQSFVMTTHDMLSPNKPINRVDPAFEITVEQFIVWPHFASQKRSPTSRF